MRFFNQPKARSGERGAAILLVLGLLTVGGLLLAPALDFSSTGLRSKRIQTTLLEEQYTRDAGSEFAIWQLIFGGEAANLIVEGQESDPVNVELNGTTADVYIRMQAELSGLSVEGAEDDKIRIFQSVECDNDLDGSFNDDCAAVPANLNPEAQARYTIALNQISPDTSDGLTELFAELDTGFDYVAGSVFSPDGIQVFEPENVGSGQNPILKWDFINGTGAPGAPVFFLQTETKKFQYVVNMNKSSGLYCNAIYLLPNREKSGKGAHIVVGGSTAEGCSGGGTSVVKYVDRLVATPNELTTFTYLVVAQNVDTSTLHIDHIRDVLPQSGFTYVADSSEVWTTDTPLLGLPADFTDPLGFSPFSDTDVSTQIVTGPREEVFWDGPGGAGWNVSAAGGANDTLIIRFKADVTLTQSGSYYNEAFIGVGAGCSAPQALVSENVFTPGQEDAEYCTSYSWPTGGVIVPTYDVRASVDHSTAQGNITIDWTQFPTDADLQSWHVD